MKQKIIFPMVGTVPVPVRYFFFFKTEQKNPKSISIFLYKYALTNYEYNYLYSMVPYCTNFSVRILDKKADCVKSFQQTNILVILKNLLDDYNIILVNEVTE